MATGTVMIFVAPDGRVIAHAADFKRDRPGGFSIGEAQELRCRAALARAVFDAFASPALVDATDTYGRDQVVQRLMHTGYKRYVIEVEFEGGA